MELTDCRWPPLPDRYAEALREAVAFVLAQFSPAAIVAAGSVVRGAGDPRSDIDLLVVHAAAYRQRLQRRYAGVPVEILVNPPEAVRDYFVSEHRRASPSTARMLMSGFVVLDDPVLGALREEAAQWLERRSAPTADEDIWACYEVATTLEDAEDVRPRDPAMASILLGEAVTEALRHWLHVRDGVLPGRKDLLRRVREADTELGSLSEQLFSTPGIDERILLARQIAQRCVGAVGFFEWDSARLPVPGRREEPDAGPSTPARIVKDDPEGVSEA
jgi:predicted nucleotidyltransferase